MDCSLAESLYSINDVIAEEAAAYSKGGGVVNFPKSAPNFGIGSQSAGATGTRTTGNVSAGKINQMTSSRKGNRAKPNPSNRGKTNILSRYG